MKSIKIRLKSFYRWLIELPFKPRDMYWVGGDGRWNDRSHWAITRDGKGGYHKPRSKDNVTIVTGGTLRVENDVYMFSLNIEDTKITTNE